jgi:peroxiredoxin
MELLRDRRSEFDAVGVQPIGISRDSPWTHIAWTQALDLNFGLLSDWNAEAVHAFGITQEFRGLKDVAERSAFLLDAGGVVRGAWRYEASELPDVDELLAACRDLKSSPPSS